MRKTPPSLPLQKVFIFFLIICLAALIGSFLAQYIWNLQPCNLCIAQRVPYAIAVALVFGGLFFKKYHVIFQLLALCFLVGLAISLYHLAVQYGLLKDRCKATAIANDIQVFEDLLLRKKGCGEISWKLFGVPMPLINSMLFALLATAAHYCRKSRVVQAMKYFGR